MNIKHPSSKLARWSLLLMDYDFDLIYRQGDELKSVNALSRSVSYQQDVTIEEFTKQIEVNAVVNDNVTELKGDPIALSENISVLCYCSQDSTLNS